MQQPGPASGRDFFSKKTMKKTNLIKRYAHLHVGALVEYMGKEVTIVEKWPKFHQFQYYDYDGKPLYGGLDQCKPKIYQKDIFFNSSNKK